MDTSKTEESVQVSKEKFFGLVDMVTSSIGIGATWMYPNPEDWGPLGPGGPVMTQPLEKYLEAVTPRPEPWRKISFDPQRILFGRAAYVTAIAQAVVDRAELLQDISEATRREGERPAGGSGHVAKCVDDWCGNGYIGLPPKWSDITMIPIPHPLDWIDWRKSIKIIDFGVLARHLEFAAKTTHSAELRQSFVTNAKKARDVIVSDFR